MNDVNVPIANLSTKDLNKNTTYYPITIFLKSFSLAKNEFTEESSYPNL